MAYFNVVSQHLLAGTEENHINSGQRVSWQRFEAGTSIIWTRNINQRRLQKVEWHRNMIMNFSVT